MKRLRMLLAAGIVFSVTGAALCQATRPGSRPFAAAAGWILREPGDLEQLGLTDEQKQKVKEIMAEAGKANREWNEANKDKLAAAQAAREEARRNQDQVAMA